MMPFKAFCDLVNDNLSGDGKDARREIGKAIDQPYWGMDAFDLVKTAAAEVDLRKIPTENTVKNLKGGKGDWNVALAAYYWLHRNFPESTRLESIDGLIFSGKKLREIAEAAGLSYATPEPEVTIQLNLVPPLMVACQGQDLEIIRRILANGVDVNQTDEKDWTALMVASQCNYVEAIDLLLDEGAKIEGRTYRGWTPLLIACQHGCLEAATRLIERDADMNNVNDAGWTGLMVACQFNHEAVIDHFLDKRADIERRNVYGWSALMVASQHGYAETVEKLLRKNAALDHQNMRGLTAKDIAVENGHEAIAQRLKAEEQRRSASQS